MLDRLKHWQNDSMSRQLFLCKDFLAFRKGTVHSASIVRFFLYVPAQNTQALNNLTSIPMRTCCRFS